MCAQPLTWQREEAPPHTHILPVREPSDAPMEPHAVRLLEQEAPGSRGKSPLKGQSTANQGQDSGQPGLAVVPCSSGGRTSGSQGSCLGPGRHPRGTCGKQRRSHVTTMQTLGPAGAGTVMQGPAAAALWPSQPSEPKAPFKASPPWPMAHSPIHCWGNMTRH